MMMCSNCKNFKDCGGAMCGGTPHCEHFRPRHGGPRKKRPVIRSDGKRYESIASAARDQYGGAAPENIGQCCRGIKPTAYGYEWRYADEEEKATA